MIRHDLHPPEEVRWIVRTLESAGYRAWAVGGAVRDALRKRAGGDWDLTTSARPRDVQRLFRRTAPIGIAHGTVGVIGRSGRMYEVTTFRRDVETDGRHARVVFSDDLDEDLARRDFTINAVAWHPLTGEVRDPYGGMADLDAGILRTVGDPAARFAEDRLRVLRALRFAGSFDLRIADDTWRAIVASSDQLGHLSAERIREELWKVLEGQRTPSRTLDLYARSGVLRALYPELDSCRETPFDHGEGTLWDHLVQAAEQASQSRPHVRLAALLHAVALPQGASGSHERAGRSAAIARTLLQRLRSSNADVDRITHLVAHHAPLPSADASDADLRRWLRRIGPAFRPDLFRLVIAICRAHPPDAQRARRILTVYRRTCRILREDPRPALSVGDLAISGADLKALGLRPGPKYGRLLNELLERVTDEPSLNTREGLLRVASELLQDSPST